MFDVMFVLMWLWIGNGSMKWYDLEMIESMGISSMAIVLMDKGLKLDSWKDDSLIDDSSMKLYGESVATPGEDGNGDASL